MLVGGYTVGRINGSAFPLEMIVEYIKVYHYDIKRNLSQELLNRPTNEEILKSKDENISENESVYYLNQKSNIEDINSSLNDKMNIREKNSPELNGGSHINRLALLIFILIF